MAGSFITRNFEKTYRQFNAELDEDCDDFASLDEIDGADDLYFRKRFFLNCHKSIVFKMETVLPDILNDYKEVMTGMTTLTEDKGVFKKIIRQGDGTFPTADAEIFLHYNGFLEGDDEPFDASIMRRNFKVVKLEDSALFPGMQLAVESMQYNEVAQFIFTPRYFYGLLGCPPKIPRGLSSMFFIELLDIKNEQGGKKIFEKDYEELQTLPLQEVIGEVEKLNDKGNAKYKLNRYDDAIIRYRMGLQVLDNYIFGTAEEELTGNSLKLKIMGNLVQCYLMTKNEKKALQVCKLSLRRGMPKPMNAKIHFRYAKLLILRGDLETALNILREGMTIEPNNLALLSSEKEVKEMLQKQNKQLLPCLL